MSWRKGTAMHTTKSPSLLVKPAHIGCLFLYPIFVMVYTFLTLLKNLVGLRKTEKSYAHGVPNASTPRHSMVKVSTGNGIYYGPILCTRIAKVTTEYPGEVSRQEAIEFLQHRGNRPVIDALLYQDEKHQGVRNMLFVIIHPGMTFHGRN